MTGLGFKFQKNLLAQSCDVGVDIEKIARFRAFGYSDFKPFYERIFTPKEIEYCLSFKTPAPHFTANFAGKEAIYKALQKHQGINLLDIEILRDIEGRPYVNLHSRRKDLHESSMMASFQIKLSLSHSSSYAVAFAIVFFPKNGEEASNGRF